jgi:rhamnosyltransferase
MNLGRLGAITVTFNPELSDGRLGKQLRDIRSHAELHLVIDNGSRNVEQLASLVNSIDQGVGRTRLVRMDRNLGIGDAINRGAASFQQGNPVDWVLLLDQDTNLYPDSFAQLERELLEVGSGDTIAVVGFNYPTHHFNRSGAHNPSPHPSPMRMTITSGSLVRASVLARHPLDGGLFMYAVDTDYCYRLRQLGFTILVLSAASIDHQEAEFRLVQGSPRWYLEPYRLFYVTRNSFTVARRYSTLRPALFAVYMVYMNVVAHVNPGESMRYAFRGFLAFLRGDRSGPAPTQIT